MAFKKEMTIDFEKEMTMDYEEPIKNFVVKVITPERPVGNYFSNKRDHLLTSRGERDSIEFINTPDEMLVFLRGRNASMRDYSKKSAKENFLLYFHTIAEKNRVDLLEVFFAEGYLDFSDLIRYPEQKLEFYFLMINAMEKGAVDVVKFFIEEGMNVDARLEYGITPLTLACSRNKIDIVKLLLGKGANPNPESVITSPVKAAMNCDDVNILDQLIVYGANLNKDTTLWNNIYWKSYNGKRDANYQRIADANILPSTDVYREVVSFSEENPHLRGIVNIMQCALKRNGIEVE